MADKYYVIHQSDQDCYITEHTKESLLKDIKDAEGHMRFAQDVKKSNPAYWNDKYLIIKGEIVVPKPKQVVKEWDIL